MSCPYVVNDGAYVLGALAPAERAEFEDHLAGCPVCRDSVATLAVLPGLLGRLGSAEVEPADSAPPELLPRVLAAARSQRRAARRRQMFTLAAAVVAVAALVVTVGVGIRLFRPTQPVAVIETPEFSNMLSPDGSERVVAEIGIMPDHNGTVVMIRCLYHGRPEGTWPLYLVVYPRDEAAQAESLGSWVARPEEQVTYSTVTRYSLEQIDRFELQGDNHAMIAVWHPT